MKKEITLKCAKDADAHLVSLRESAVRAMDSMRVIMDGGDAMRFLREIKFNPIGCQPLDSNSPLNLIEQVNQTFTCLASFKAARLLFEWHPNLGVLALNLGTASGYDIHSEQCGGIVAEVFAAAKPSNNDKLNKDVAKVSQALGQHKYVFFMCPNYGAKQIKKERGILVYPLGMDWEN